MDKYNVEKTNQTSTQSMHECTGLFPRPPQSEEEYEAYQELFGMEIPKKK